VALSPSISTKNGGTFAKWVKWVPKWEFNSNIGEVLCLKRGYVNLQALLPSHETNKGG